MSDKIKIGDVVRIDSIIENQYRPVDMRPNYDKTYVVTDTDGDRAIVRPQDGEGRGWIVSYAALVKVS